MGLSVQITKRTGYDVGVPVDFRDKEPYRNQMGIPFFERYLRTELIILHLVVSFEL